MEMTGVDISRDLLEIAKRKAPKSTFIHESLFGYEFEFADIVCATGEPFNYLFDERGGNNHLHIIISYYQT